MKRGITHVFLAGFLIITGIFQSCRQEKRKEAVTESETKKELAFKQRKIVDSAKYWWAHTPADISGDGIADLLFINNNSGGGYLGYYKGQKEDGLWELNIIAEKPPTGGLFASGDLEAADIDGDGDTDVFAVKHPGEWADAGATAEIFWYESDNGTWKPHTIGTVPDAIKDVSFADFDTDGKLDIALLTFDEHTLSIFKQVDSDTWQKVQYIENEVLHEGMDVGDLNNDRYPDIVATGMIYYNPGSDLTKPWVEENLDEQWNNQEGDWSRNGTKTFIRDIDGDGQSEIYMGHSERAGYPLAVYQKLGDSWNNITIADSIPACHTLQVYDFDLDGDFDVMAGINKGRAVNLNKTNFDVSIFINEGDYANYEKMIIETNGIYNGQAVDYDGDGDMDIFRYPDHEATDFFVLENLIN
ncbi:FG-GAP repeat domain-containing protein [Ulvibacterium marinum]|uniref:VCBS repeat-containing protein n=1 Tax=Ulvibacterium marinum TaxID=2419782 RepID=A0A3B0BWM6_9FLAO|nr:VCBS repeat-containing protein [Ulvibacterium marinum]RKN76891.1 VCBS repeat-containing protein [Ulvibacterium marinum]